jgi:hypothetical protein
MKHFFHHSLAGLLVFAYAVSIVGMGIYYCRCEETSRLALLAHSNHECGRDRQHIEEMPSCCGEEAASEDCAGASACEPEDAAGQCCIMQVARLQTDHNLPATVQKTVPVFFLVFVFCQPSAFFTNHPAALTAAAGIPPPILFDAKHSLFSRAMQWRL